MTNISLRFAVAGRDELAAAASQVGTAFGDAMQSGVAKANGALKQLEENLKRIHSVGGGHGLGAEIEQQISQAERAVGAHSRTISSHLTSAFAPLSSVGRAIRGIEGSFIRLNFTVAALERVGRGVEAVFAKPFESLMTATDDARKFELAISGVTGGLQNARAVNAALLADLKNIPLSLEDVRRETEVMSRTGFLTSTFANADPQEAAAQAASYASTVAKLSALNPQTSTEAIISTLQQSANGQSRSMRYRLGIDPSDLTKMEGVNQKSFTGNPELLMQALGKYTDVYGNGLDSGRGDLASVVYEKLKDTLGVALQKIGDDGVYDQVVDRLKSITGSIMDYLNGTQFAGRAQELSKSVGGIFDGLGESLLRLVQTASGASDLAHTPDAIAKQIGSILGEISTWSSDLPGISASVGRELRSIASDVGTFISALHTVAHPIEAMKSAASEYAPDNNKLSLIVQRLNDLGLTGASVGNMKVHRPEFVEGYYGQPVRTHPDDRDEMATPLWKGTPIVDTSHVPAGARRLLAEQIQQALSDKDVSQLHSTDEVKWELDQAIPNFRNRLSGALSSQGLNAAYRIPADLQSQISSVGNERIEPNYAAKFHSLDLLAESISSWSNDSDKLTAAFGTAGAKLRELTGAGGASAFDQIKNWRDSSISKMTGVIGNLQGEQQRDPAHARQLQDPIGALQDGITKLVDGYQHELDTLGDEIRQKVGAFGVQISQSVSKEGAVYASEVLQAFADGRTVIQQQAAALLSKNGLPSDVGFNAIPLAQQQPFSDQLLKQQLSSVKSLGASGVGYGQFESSSPDAMSRMGLSGPLPANDSIASLLANRPSTASQNAQFYQQALSRSQSTYDTAQQTLSSATPGTPEYTAAQQAFTQAKNAIAQLRAEIQQTAQANGGLTSSFVQFGNAAQSALSSGLGKSLTDVETKTGKLRDTFAAMARDILTQFNEIETRQIFNTVLGPSDGKVGIGHGIGGLFGLGINALGSLFSSAGGSSNDAIDPGGELMAADGGIFPGGLRFFASGGIVKGGPGQLAVIGEGGLGADEAVVPMRSGFVPIGHDGAGFHAALPGGRRIPAAMFADGGITGSAATRGAFVGSPIGAQHAYGNGSGDGVGDIHTHVAIHLDGQQIATHTYKHSREQLRKDNMKMLGPGGDGRRALGQR